MNNPIILDPENLNWLLLEQIMNMTRSQVVKKAMAQHDVVPVEKAGLPAELPQFLVRIV